MRTTFLIYTAFGPPAESLSLETAELPALEPGRIRVAMSLAPVNPSDLIPITGAYAHRIPLPSIAGYEGVGRVVGAAPALSFAGCAGGDVRCYVAAAVRRALAHADAAGASAGRDVPACRLAQRARACRPARRG